MAMLALRMGESEVVLEFPGDADGIEKAIAIAEEMKLEVSKSESGNFLIKISADSVRKLQEVSEKFLSQATEFID